MFERINRKLTNVARLHILISEAEGQLQQARTENERKSLQAKIRDFARMKRKHDQTVRKRRETLRAKKAAAFYPGGSLFNSFVEKADDGMIVFQSAPGCDAAEEALVQAAPQSNESFATQYRSSTSMLTLKKPIGPRIRRARRKRAKFVTPDLVRVGGQLLRHVASLDNPLSRAEYLRGEYAEMENGHHAKVVQLLQRAYFVTVQFQRRPREFERLQAHSFWKQWREKPGDRSTSKWVLYFIMQATTTNDRNRARKYATVLDGLIQDKVESSAVASRIKELGGIDAACEAMQARTCG